MAPMKKFSAKARMLGLAAVMAVAPVAAHAALVDPSFEAKGSAMASGQSYCYDSGADNGASGGGPCAASPWGGTSGVIATGSGPWGGTLTPAGNYYAFVQGTSVLQQTFVADASSHYLLKWLDAGRTNNGGPQTYDVSIAGPGGSIFLGSYTTNGGGFIQRTSGDFVLQGGSQYTLTYTGVVAQDVTSFIDNVQLSAVPETATWLMMIAGFGLLGLALRRRERTALRFA